MDESKKHAVEFLEKEIKTYAALSLFLAKKDIKDHVRVGESKVMFHPAYYKERLKEAKKLVNELRKTN
jgi:NCAIR mutase (PurE)-related protein